MLKSPVERALGAYHPNSLPRMSRAGYRRELAAWSLLPVMVAVVEGGVTGVIVKNVYTGTASPLMLNIAVAIISGGPALANIASFLWSAWYHGRDKIKCLWIAQLGTVAMVSLVALAPATNAGLIGVVVGVVGARIFWTGVMLLRTTVWRANYPRNVRARITGNLATVQSLVMMVATLTMGAAINLHHDAFRWLYPIAGLLGLAGAWIYRGLRIRGHRAMLREERNDRRGSLVNPLHLRHILLEDKPYRQYMTAMFVFGMGNLMVMAPLVIVMKDQFDLDALQSVLIVTSIPMLMMPAVLPLWSRLLDRVHVVRYRSVHAWAFVSFSGALLLACLTNQIWLLYVAAILNGVANGGGVLAWNLGHHDFATPAKAGQYMSVHITLTGIRGICAPLIAIALYEWLDRVVGGNGVWVFAACTLLNSAGALWFVVLARGMKREKPVDQTDVPPVTKTVARE